MIEVRNIKRITEISPEQTVILPGSSDLPKDEQVYIDRKFGNAVRSGYENWELEKSRHSFKIVSQSQFVFVKALDNTGTYNGDLLADCFYAICLENEKENKQLVMVGLPGKTKTERERARQDLLRWFSSSKQSLIVFCEEA